MKSLIIVNPADCIGCRTCEVACVVAHPSEQELNADIFLPRLKVQRLDSISAPVMCHQCENAPCVGACPVGALTMGEQVVQANSARCIGCQSCVSGKRAARTVLTGMCYSVGSATRQGSSSPTRFIGQSAMTSRT